LGGPPRIFETVEKTAAMAAKSKNIFARYRRALCIVLAVLVYLGLLAAVRYYRHYRWVKNNPVSVYDLKWPDKSDEGDVVFRRWRYYIETKTNLPRKIEKYYKLDPNDKYILEETLIVGYPTDEQVRQAIKDAGF